MSATALLQTGEVIELMIHNITHFISTMDNTMTYFEKCLALGRILLVDLLTPLQESGLVDQVELVHVYEAPKKETCRK